MSVNNFHNILYICSININKFNACLIHSMSMANAFALQNNCVDIIFPSDGNHEHLKVFGRNVRLFPKIKFKKIPFKNSLIGLMNTFSIINHIKKHNINLVYSRSHVLSFITILCIRVFTKVKIASEHNGDFYDEVLSIKNKKFLAFMAKKFQIFDMKLSHFIRVVTPGIKKIFENYGVDPNKIFVIGNGTDTNFFKPYKRDDIMQKLNLDSSKFYIGFMGNLAPWQGIDWALKNIANVMKHYENIHLLIAGEGFLLGKLKEIADKLNVNNKVTFLGNVSYSDAPLIINAFDIAIAPFIKSRNERIGLSPLKIRDYAACGKPVLASDIEGIRENASESGIYTFEPEDGKDFTTKLLYLIENKHILKTMSEKAQNFAKQNYDWQLLAKQIMNHINNGK